MPCLSGSTATRRIAGTPIETPSSHTESRPTANTRPNRPTSDAFPRHHFLLAFSLLSVLMGTSAGTAVVVAALYGLSMGADERMLGLIAGSQSVGILIMGLPVGVLVDRYGPTRLFVLGNVLGGVVYALIPLIRTPEFLLQCMALISFFMPMRFVSINTLFMERLEVVGVSKAGWGRAAYMLGLLLVGPLFAAKLVQVLDFATIYRLIAASFGLTVLLSPIVFSGYVRPARAAKRLNFRDIGASVALLGQDPQLRQICSSEFMVQALNAYYSFFIIVIAIHVIGLNSESASGLVAAEGCSMVAALLFLGHPVSRMGSHVVFRIGLAAILGALLLLGLGPSAPPLWVGGILLGLGLGMLQIVVIARLARVGSRFGQGKVSGLNALVGPSGSFLGSLLGGVFGHTLGLQAVFLLFAPMFVLVVAPLLFARSSNSPRAVRTDSTQRRIPKPSLAAALAIALVSASPSPIPPDFSEMEGTAAELWLKLRSAFEPKSASAATRDNSQPI